MCKYVYRQAIECFSWDFYFLKNVMSSRAEEINELTGGLVIALELAVCRYLFGWDTSKLARAKSLKNGFLKMTSIENGFLTIH